MLASARVAWPPSLKAIFRWLSSMSFNVDLAAPECAVPSLPPEYKWGFFQALPITLAIVISLWAFVNVQIKTVCCADRKKGGDDLEVADDDERDDIDTSTPEGRAAVAEDIYGSFQAMYVTGFYLTYVQLCKKSLEVFSCTPTDDEPPKYYMDMQPEEECYLEGGLHLFLFPYAIGTGLLYGLGFPAYIAYNLRAHAMPIEYDQLLRAMDSGHTHKTNPYFTYRQRFHRLYYLFKPEKYFWILAILARKLSITLVSLMFKRVPTFQLALALGVMFVASCMQYVHQPYMGMQERAGVIAEHLKKEEEERMAALAGLSAFGGDQSSIHVDESHKKHLENLRKRQKSKKEKMPRLPFDQEHIQNYAQLTDSVKHLFTDYNTLESSLLSSSVMVTLSGVMFGSGYFDNVANNSKKELVTWMMILLVNGSLVFLGRMFYLEIKGGLLMKKIKNQHLWKEAKKRFRRVALEQARELKEKEARERELEKDSQIMDLLRQQKVDAAKLRSHQRRADQASKAAEAAKKEAKKAMKFHMFSREKDTRTKDKLAKKDDRKKDAHRKDDRKKDNHKRDDHKKYDRRKDDHKKEEKHAKKDDHKKRSSVSSSKAKESAAAVVGSMEEFDDFDWKAGRANHDANQVRNLPVCRISFLVLR